MRLFIEIPIDDVRPFLPILGRLKTIPGIRITDSSQIHITIAFIGDNDEPKRIIDSIGRSASGFRTFDIDIGKMGFFGGNGRSSIIWIGAEPSDTLTELADTIREGLDADGIGYDDKPFKAHITLGRSKNGSIPSESMMKSYDRITTIRCNRVLVMSSEQTGKGYVHRVLSEIMF